MEVLLITLAKTLEPDSGRFPGQSYLNVVLGLAYVSLILNFGSIMSALKLVDLLGKTKYLNLPRGTGHPTNRTNLEPTFTTKPHGVNRLPRLLVYHCEFPVKPMCLGARTLRFQAFTASSWADCAFLHS